MKNKSSLLWELNQADVHLKRIILELKEGAFDDENSDFAFSTELEHVLNHIVLGWHYRNLSSDEIRNLSQEKFEEISRAIPNFGFNMKMLEGLDFAN